MLLVSVHTPKAGGTSVGAILRKAYGGTFRNEDSFNPADPLSAANVSDGPMLSVKATVDDGIECLHGHFAPRQIAFDDSARLFTLLRDPVDNAVSIYFYWKSADHAYDRLHEAVLNNRLDIFEFARLPLIQRLYSETYFGRFDMGRFDVIGRHEARVAALTRLSGMIGRELDINIVENVTPVRSDRHNFLADLTAVRRLGDLLIEDMRFYDRYGDRT